MASKCVFFRPEHNVHLQFNFEGFLDCKYEINQRTRSQWVEEKMGLFVELLCLLPKLWLLKCQKCHFYVFSADESKKIVKFWAQHVRTTEWSSWVNIITRQMTPFFHLLFELGTFHFSILRPSEFNSVVSPSAFCFGL